MTSYSVRVSREGKWWMISIPEVDGLTQARRLSEVETMARSLVSSLLDVGPGTFDLDITLEAIEDANLTAMKNSAEVQRGELEAAQANYGRRLRSDARKLADNGIAARDIGYVLGVSHQRAAQLLES